MLAVAITGYVVLALLTIGACTDDCMCGVDWIMSIFMGVFWPISCAMWAIIIVAVAIVRLGRVTLGRVFEATVDWL